MTMLDHIINALGLAFDLRNWLVPLVRNDIPLWLVALPYIWLISSSAPKRRSPPTK